jgi:hypothetical protein
MPHFVEIQTPGSPARQHELLGPITLGSGPEAEIRLPETAGVAGRHLVITRSEQGAHVALVSGVHGAIVFRGKECSEALVPWGEDVFAGSVRLGFVSRSKRDGSPLLLLLAPVLLLAVGMTFLPQLGGSVDRDNEVEPPPLGLSELGCREQEPARAAQRARELEHAARAKVQRSAFVAHDGVQALDRFQEAAACYRTAGGEGEADRIQAEHDRWSARLNQDYAAARLKLRVALDRDRPGDALNAVRSLQALLSGRPASPYTEWLSSLQRQLERQLAKSGS